MKLKKKLTKFERARLKLTSAGITITKTKPDGSKSYQGGPKLKQTQEYPKKFAAKVYSLHSKLKAGHESIWSLACGTRTLFLREGWNGLGGWMHHCKFKNKKR